MVVQRSRHTTRGTTLAALALVVASLVLAACTTVSSPTRISYDFRSGMAGWQAGFADLPPNENSFYELASSIRALPSAITPTGTGYFLSGNNHSDDLFMFLKRHLTRGDGIVPNRTYRLSFRIVFASNAPTRCNGVGGAPGEGVTLKAGGSATEPLAILNPQENLYRMNVDKANQVGGGPAGSAIGGIQNGIPCDEAFARGEPYVSLTRQHTSEFPITSDAQGNLWLLVGTDSGFEATTAIYYQAITVDLMPQ